MSRLVTEEVLSGTLTAQQTLWNQRYSIVNPDVESESTRITVTAFDNYADITINDEPILSIIEKYGFVPKWLLYQWGGNDIEEHLQSWVTLGLIWIEASSIIGLYVRPTALLYRLFDDNPQPYHNISYTHIQHIICEEQVMWELLVGITPICENIQTMPFVSALGLVDDDNHGVNALCYNDCKSSNESGQFITFLDTADIKIKQEISQEQNITSEFKDFTMFALHNTISIHIPDIIIPIPRKNGSTQSIAIEVECEPNTRYKDILLMYKNNIKFNQVFWLCSSQACVLKLKEAYQEIGELGNCKMNVLELQIPHP